MNKRDEFLHEMFYNSPFSTDSDGFQYHVVEVFSFVYSVKVFYKADTDEYVVIDWKNESN